MAKSAIPATRSSRLELPLNATLRLPRGRCGSLVRVERGTVMVTRQGDLDDHVLGPGDEIRLPPAGLAVAWAFTPAIVAVTQC